MNRGIGDLREFFAHSLKGRPESEWHRLEDHLINTAKLAASFASEFGCDQWAYVSGLWHDIGKYSEEFQKMLRDASLEENSEERHRRVDHSTAGAIYAEKHFGKLGRIFAYIIAGHHAGLPDWQSPSAGNRSLLYRLQKEDVYRSIDLLKIPETIRFCSAPGQGFRTRSGHALWIRMLFSCLVDADFLDTEVFFEPDKAEERGRFPSIEELLDQFNSYMETKKASSPKTPVNVERSKILEQCISKSSEKPSIFTLTVPTGGGKTLSSMAFALNHAMRHGKKRVIYVIPYTSIIEQTADQFREIFGDVVVEHHSNVRVEDSNEEAKERLASENWDGSIIVTTTVQFFESLFSNRPGRCRKLHNIVNSVVVIDEAQLLPPEFLNPILHVIRELRENYGVTFILSTATPPALKKKETADFVFEGLEDTVEIIENPSQLYGVFRRVDIIRPEDLQSPVSWEELAGELVKHESVLCVVNRRDDCRKLFSCMPKGTFHLSALMCGAHRAKVIGEIKERLKKGQPTRVVSTQLVEAGVDLDFPVVYRALAGLDSIAQAAGRCNREGRLERGLVKIFVPPSDPPPGYLRQAESIARRLISDENADILSPDTFEKYFKELFWVQGENLDKRKILDLLKPDLELRFNFFSAASKFKIIDDSLYKPVIVLYGDSPGLIALLERNGPERWLLRRLQRFVVNLPSYVHGELVRQGAIKEVCPGIFVQDHGGLYREDVGFDPEASGIYEPDELVI